MTARSNSRVVLIGALALAACTDLGHTYSRYKPLSTEGWQRNDTVAIVMGPVRQGGHYAEQLGLRTNSHYPFMQIVLIVNQEARPSGMRRTDTLCVDITDDDGHVTGKGISHYQHLYPLPTVALNSGDTLRASINHDMLRSPLKGITEVGLTMTRNDKP